MLIEALRHVLLIVLPFSRPPNFVSFFKFFSGNKLVIQLGVLRNTGYTSDSTSFMNRNFQQRFDKNVPDSPFIDFATILTATNYFSASNKLGQGGFGPVYKVVRIYNTWEND